MVRRSQFSVWTMYNTVGLYYVSQPDQHGYSTDVFCEAWLPSTRGTLGALRTRADGPIAKLLQIVYSCQPESACKRIIID